MCECAVRVTSRRWVSESVQLTLHNWPADVRVLDPGRIASQTLSLVTYSQTHSHSVARSESVVHSLSTVYTCKTMQPNGSTGYDPRYITSFVQRESLVACISMTTCFHPGSLYKLIVYFTFMGQSNL